MENTRHIRGWHCVLVALCLASGAAHTAEWKPDRAIEMIVPTGPGSGVDNTMRTVQAILQNNRLVDQSIIVTNKPGGSYGVALNYLGQFNGDAHRVMIQTSTPLSALVVGQLNIKYFELTPVANLITEPIAFIARTESPITSGQEMAKRIKADPSSVSIALAAARGNAYHIASALLAKAVGADIRKLKIVVFNSSSEAIAALLGGHVDVVSATPGAFLPLAEAGKVRFLGLASPKRLSGPLAQVPTFKEQGLDVTFDVPRSLIGPRGLSAAQLAYWDNTLRSMMKTQAWKDAVQKNQWEEDYKNSAELGKSLKAEYEILKDVLTELGMAK
jgi:putative tricarboxylic transport membrane protein